MHATGLSLEDVVGELKDDDELTAEKAAEYDGVIHLHVLVKPLVHFAEDEEQADLNKLCEADLNKLKSWDLLKIKWSAADFEKNMEKIEELLWVASDDFLNKTRSAGSAVGIWHLGRQRNVVSWKQFSNPTQNWVTLPFFL